MKKRTLLKIFLTMAALLVLAAVIFLYAPDPPVDETQNVSFVVDHFSREAQTDRAADLSQGSSSSEDKVTAGEETVIEDGFGLADSLPPADFYLETVKDFQADVAREASRNSESVPD